jgi:hypothetical protein
MSERSTDGNVHVTVTGRVRKRAVEACTFCRRRKVGYYAVNCEDERLKPPDQV